MFAIKLKNNPMLVFLFRKPDESSVLDLDSAVDDAEIDVGANSFLWPEGTPAPMLAVGQSSVIRKQFKVFRRPEEMEHTDFNWTRLYFGGIFAPSTWDRFERQANSDPYFMVPPSEADQEIEQTAVGRERG